jgi:hypothetical protein
MGFPLGAGARDIEANSHLSNVSQPIDLSTTVAPKIPHSRLGASSAHITELCNMMQTYERHKQWAVEQRGLTIRAPTPLCHPNSARPQWTTALQSEDTSFSSACSHRNAVHPIVQPRTNSHNGLGGEGVVAARDHEMVDEDQYSMSEDEISDDAVVQPSDNSSTELCNGPPTLPSLASILAPAPTSLAQYRLGNMQKCAPEVMGQKQVVLLNLFAELSQERLDSLVGLVRLVAAVPDGQEDLRSLST